MNVVRWIASLPLVYVVALGAGTLLVVPTWALLGPSTWPVARTIGPWIEVYLSAMGTPAGPVVAMASALVALVLVWRGAFKRQDSKKKKGR